MSLRCPDHVTRAIKRFDPNLALKWNSRYHAWVFCYKGKEIMTYVHEDDTIAESDLSVSEIIHILRRSGFGARDRRNRELAAAGIARKKEVERRRQRIMESGDCESNSVTDFVRRGKQPKPFIPPLLSHFKTPKEEPAC